MAGYRLGVVLWICVCVLDGVAGSCPAGRYGYRCSYQCHCPQPNCNPTSGCQPTNCSRGWSGPTCQKVRFRRNGIQIFIAHTAASTADGVNCYNVTGNKDGTGIPDVLTATCSGEGRYLVLYTTTVNDDDMDVPVLDFCEVKVNVCGPGTFGAECDNYCHCDGDVRNYVTGVCPSGVCLPGWQTQTCDSACGLGTFGTNCSNTCHCGGEKCNHVTGVCPSGVCLPGWQTEKCDTVCESSSFGTNCTQSCSQRNCKDPISACNHVTGMCVGGCMSGWRRIDCLQVCDFGSYGSDCSETCSSRKCMCDNSSCDHVTGECVEGCMAGWDGTDCKQELQTHDTPLIHSISLVIGVVVGVVLTLLLAGGVQVYLLRTGRLTWMPGSVKEGDRQDKVDTNMSQSPDNYTSMSELSHGRRDMDDNDYAELDTDTRADNKLYDVIQN